MFFHYILKTKTKKDTMNDCESCFKTVYYVGISIIGKIPRSHVRFSSTPPLNVPPQAQLLGVGVNSVSAIQFESHHWQLFSVFHPLFRIEYLSAYSFSTVYTTEFSVIMGYRYNKVLVESSS